MNVRSEGIWVVNFLSKQSSPRRRAVSCVVNMSILSYPPPTSETVSFVFLFMSVKARSRAPRPLLSIVCALHEGLADVSSKNNARFTL